MNKVTYSIGLKRRLFNHYLKLAVLLHFARDVVAGRMPARGFIGFLRRLLYFLSKMKENKYVTSGSTTKINLYVPAFPSKAFYKACGKVAVVGGKQACISVLLSVTSACTFRCEHCYQKHDRGKDVPVEYLVDVVRTLDAMGVAFFNIEGGDPFLVFDRLKRVCAAVSTGEIWINSTGDGITRDRLDELKALGVKGIIFSLHAPDPATVNSFMGRDNAWDCMHRGIECCHVSGMDVGLNTCLMKEAFYDGTFQSTMEVARSLGASIIQLIQPKPSGAWLGSEMQQSQQQDLDHISEMVHRYNNLPEYRAYPFIAAQIHDEKASMFGCTAGGSDRFYINAKGDVQPCEFLNMSFGNILEEAFENIYERMRRAFDVPGTRWLCEEYAKDIHTLHQASGSTSLPLSPELSARIHENWDRGTCPDFYDFVETRYRNTQ